MAIKINDTVYLDFLTVSPTTGVPVDPDSGHPVVNVYEQAGTTAIASYVYGTDGEIVRYEQGYFKFRMDVLATTGYQVGNVYNVSIHWEQSTQTRRDTLITFRCMSANYETTEGVNTIYIEGQDATDQLEQYQAGQVIEFDVRLEE